MHTQALLPHRRCYRTAAATAQPLLPAAAEESTACALIGRLQVARILRDRREGHIRARAEPHEFFDNLLSLGIATSRSTAAGTLFPLSVPQWSLRTFRCPFCAAASAGVVSWNLPAKALTSAR